MVKEIERVGIPTVQICAIVPIALTVGANRVIPGIAIPYPVGDPRLSSKEEFETRKALLRKALNSLSSKIEAQTVFK